MVRDLPLPTHDTPTHDTPTPGTAGVRAAGLASLDELLDELPTSPPAAERPHAEDLEGGGWYTPPSLLGEPVEPEPPVARRIPLFVAAFVGGMLFGTVALLPFTGSPFTDPVALDRVLGSRAGLPHASPARVAALVENGFTILDEDPVAAAELFRGALELSPGHAAAAYGLGAAQLADGRTPSAERWLCDAAQADGAVGASARAMLEEHGMTCLR